MLVKEVRSVPWLSFLDAFSTSHEWKAQFDVSANLCFEEMMVCEPCLFPHLFVLCCFAIPLFFLLLSQWIRETLLVYLFSILFCFPICRSSPRFHLTARSHSSHQSRFERIVFSIECVSFSVFHSFSLSCCCCGQDSWQSRTRAETCEFK